MASELIWAITCIGIGLILVLVEVFIPSAGLFGLLAAGLIVWGLVLAFQYSTAVGFRFLAGTAACLPLVLLAAVYLWPRTLLASRVTLHPPSHAELHDDIRDH